MNDRRRASLRSATEYLRRAQTMIAEAASQEQDCLDNLPESLEGTDRYEKMESAVENLEEAQEELDSVLDHLQNAMA